VITILRVNWFGGGHDVVRVVNWEKNIERPIDQDAPKLGGSFVDKMMTRYRPTTTTCVSWQHRVGQGRVMNHRYTIDLCRPLIHYSLAYIPTVVPGVCLLL
jgi:hypothetical protein